MSELKICANPECLTEFTPNKKGATKSICSRCYAYSRRHVGQLPGPREDIESTHQISVRVSDGYEKRVTKVSYLTPATWARKAIESKLEEVEHRQAGSPEKEKKK